MAQNIISLNNKIFSDNNNLLLQIVNDLEQLMNYSHDNTIIKILANVINRINYIINENKKYFQLIRNDISYLKANINKGFQELKYNNINNINNQQILQRADGKYIGQVVNGLAMGKGTCYFINGDSYEGDWKNNKEEGKGIYRYKSGDIYEGDFKNDIRHGKGIYYYINGDRYEGDFKNGKREGQGIIYRSNGDRMMGDYSNDKPIGKHVVLTRNGDVNFAKLI